MFLQLKNTVKYITLLKCSIKCKCVDKFTPGKSISKIEYENYRRCFDANRNKQHEMIDEQEKNIHHYFFP